MLNFLLIAGGCYAIASNDSSDAQRTLGGAIFAVGLTRVLNEADEVS